MSEERRAAAPGAAIGAPTKVIELVGLPGTGKSTVTRALLASGDARVGLVKLRRPRNLPFLVKHGLRFALPFALRYRALPERRWKRFSQLVQLLTFHDAVAAEAHERELLLLDQGPVYLMSILQQALLAPGVTGPAYEAHWDATLSGWARRLDLVVRLDAADELLHQRVRDRGSRHPVLTMSREEAAGFFARVRRSHDRLLTTIQRHSPGTAVVRLDTGELSPQETVDRILELALTRR